MDLETQSPMAHVFMAVPLLLFQYLDLDTTRDPMVKASRTHHCGSFRTSWNHLDQNGPPTWPIDSIHHGN